MLGFKSVTVFVFIFSLLCINHNAVAQTVVSLQSVGTGITTKFNANPEFDSFPAILGTGTFVSKEFGINQFSSLIEIAAVGEDCITSPETGSKAGSLLKIVEPEPGSLIINVPSKGGKEGISQLTIEINKHDTCLTDSLNFSTVQEGTIVGGTGTFAGATGTITSVFAGTALQLDDTGDALELFITFNGLSTLTLDD